MSGNKRNGEESKNTETSGWVQVACVLAAATVACAASAALSWFERNTGQSTIEGDGAVASTESGDGNTRPCKRQKTNEGDGAAGAADTDDHVEITAVSQSSMQGKAYTLEGEEIKVHKIVPGYVETYDGNGKFAYIPKENIEGGVVYTTTFNMHEIPEKDESEEEIAWVATTGYVIRKNDSSEKHLKISAFFEGGVLLDDMHNTFLSKDEIRDGAVYRISSKTHVIPDVPFA